jgi:hypothetical protein
MHSSIHTSGFALSCTRVKRFLSFTFAAAAIAITASCASVPKLTYEPLNESFLREDGGPVVLVDVCVLQDAIGDADDYYLIAESKQGAEKIAEAARTYLTGLGITPKATIVPFACGVTKPEAPAASLVRMAPDSPSAMLPQPFAPHEAIKDDAELHKALMVLMTSTYAEGVPRVLLPQQSGKMPPLKNHTAAEIAAAAELVRTKLNASSAIVIHVAGYSQTTGKAAAGNAGRIFVGVLTGVLTGVAFIPGGATDGSIMTSGVVDLKTGVLVRSSAMRGLGDPRKPEVVSNQNLVNLVMRGITHRAIPEGTSAATTTGTTGTAK